MKLVTRVPSQKSEDEFVNGRNQTTATARKMPLNENLLKAITKH